MRKLAKLIETELQRQEICAVYDSHLGRVWPPSMNPAKRMQQIKHFARQRGLAVTFYDIGLCAIFEKAKAPARGAKRVLVLDSEGQVSSDARLDSEGAKPSRKRRR